MAESQSANRLLLLYGEDSLIFAEVKERDGAVVEANCYNVNEWRGLNDSNTQVVLDDIADEEGERVEDLPCEYIDQTE
jgi:hypothetical protein